MFVDNGMACITPSISLKLISIIIILIIIIHTDTIYVYIIIDIYISWWLVGQKHRENNQTTTNHISLGDSL